MARKRFADPFYDDPLDEASYARQSMINQLDSEEPPADNTRGTTSPVNTAPANEDPAVAGTTVAPRTSPSQVPIQSGPTRGSFGHEGEVAYDRVQQYYQTYLGRTPSPEEVWSHLNGGRDLGRVNTTHAFDTIRNSPEYKKLHPVEGESPTEGTTTPGGSSTTGPPTSTNTQPGSTPGSTPGSQTAWGFNSRGGGRAEVPYTPQQFEGELPAFGGFNLDQFNNPDAASSMKYVFLNASRGLPLDANFTTAVAERLRAMGIPATAVSTDSIDFGLGEGPMDVIRGGTEATGYHDLQWMPAGGGGGGAAAVGADQMTGTGSSGVMTSPQGLSPELQDMLSQLMGGGANEQIMKALQELLNGTVPRTAIMDQLEG